MCGGSCEWSKGDFHACTEGMKQNLSQSITEMPTSITHTIPRQNQQILKALKGVLVSGAVPDKFISAPRVTVLGKKMLTSNTYSYHENAALSNLGLWNQAGCAGGKRHCLWERVAEGGGETQSPPCC